MPFGWSGKILRVDLSKKKSSAEAVTPYTKSFIGGRGISVKIMYDEVDPKISPFDPENMLLFAPGVLTGTPAPTASRAFITTMGPNGLIGNAGFGGYIGAEIRHAGYDNIIVQGKSDNPVYLFIHDNGVEFRDASRIWGKGTLETQQIIKSEIGDPDVEVLCIGLAGENLVGFACVRTGIFSTAGRGGMGAIMASKNLKAIAVRGKGDIEIANKEEFLKTAYELRKKLTEYRSLQPELGVILSDVNLFVEEDGKPTGNWEDVDWNEIKPGNFVQGVSQYYKQYGVAKVGCFGCPIFHYHSCNDPETGLGVTKCASPTNFTLRIWNRDWKVATTAVHLCNNYGLDVISTANIIAFLMELYHVGIITPTDTDGIPMIRGNKEAIISTIHKIARQEGFGKLFKDGVLSAAKIIGNGAEECAMQVKGIEMTFQEFRAKVRTALGCAVATKLGGGEYLLPKAAWSVVAPYEKIILKNRAPSDKYVRDAFDLIGICKCTMPRFEGGSLEIPAKLFSLATGVNTSESELLTAAERVHLLERAFDVLRGIRRKDDTLPKRMFERPVSDGPHKGRRLERENFDKLLDEYYAVMGWDEDGIPKEETFKKLGLSSEWQVFSNGMKREGRIHV